MRKKDYLIYLNFTLESEGILIGIVSRLGAPPSLSVSVRYLPRFLVEPRVVSQQLKAINCTRRMTKAQISSKISRTENVQFSIEHAIYHSGGRFYS